jgi:uncharacterized caspase-like protein
MTPRRAFLHLLGGLTLGAAASAAWAAPGRKLALVIGNGAYARGGLKNPVNDARAVAESLRQLGFEVQFHADLTMARMIEAMRGFSVRAVEAEVRLIYFAGHGLQLKGRNYLLPVDADVREEQDVASRGADIGELIERLARIGSGFNIVILDACRNNPFAGGEVLGPDGRRVKLRGIGGTGLAAIDAPVGTMVAFATAPGGIAFDNPSDDHSLYTKHLVAKLQTPGLPIEMLFKQVRLNVVRDTNRQQVPWESSSLTGDFCFRTGTNGTCSVLR